MFTYEWVSGASLSECSVCLLVCTSGCLWLLLPIWISLAALWILYSQSIISLVYTHVMLYRWPRGCLWVFVSHFAIWRSCVYLVTWFVETTFNIININYTSIAAKLHWWLCLSYFHGDFKIADAGLYWPLSLYGVILVWVSILMWCQNWGELPWVFLCVPICNQIMLPARACTAPNVRGVYFNFICQLIYTSLFTHGSSRACHVLGSVIACPVH